MEGTTELYNHVYHEYRVANHIHDEYRVFFPLVECKRVRHLCSEVQESVVEKNSSGGRAQVGSYDTMACESYPEHGIKKQRGRDKGPRLT